MALSSFGITPKHWKPSAGRRKTLPLISRDALLPSAISASGVRKTRDARCSSAARARPATPPTSARSGKPGAEARFWRGAGLGAGTVVHLLRCQRATSRLARARDPVPFPSVWALVLFRWSSAAVRRHAWLGDVVGALVAHRGDRRASAGWRSEWRRRTPACTEGGRSGEGVTARGR